MREIKFRGICLKTGEWVYGDVHFNADCTKAHIHKRGDRVKSHDIDPTTVGQYIDRKDKNGVEIYKGDILVICETRPPLSVAFRDGSFGYITHNCFISFLHLLPGDLEVIGNIHENPELLERKCYEC